MKSEFTVPVVVHLTLFKRLLQAKVILRQNTVFNEKEITSSDSSGDSVVRSEDVPIVDVFEDLAEKKSN